MVFMSENFTLHIDFKNVFGVDNSLILMINIRDIA